MRLLRCSFGLNDSGVKEMLTSLLKCVKDNTAPYKAWFITLDVEHSVNMMLLEYARSNDAALFTLFRLPPAMPPFGIPPSALL